MKKRTLFGVLAAVVLLGLAIWGIWRAVTRTTVGLALTGGTVAANTLVDNLSSSDRDLVMTSLELLKARRNPAGQAKARSLLNSSDDYIWFNAALYLGAIKDSQAVPYLIKGLKHPAYRAYPEVISDLQSLTGQSFGSDQSKWINWWKNANPTSQFSFDYASLQQQAAEIQTGSNILINRVIDPLHISHIGSPIVLVGIRLKKNANPASAQRLLGAAVLAQFVEIKRDGDQLAPDGSVPAVIYWEPDTINSPAMSNQLRAGLPPVPFSTKTSVQKYLLQSGLYELDVSTVHDVGLRAELRGYVPATQTTGATTRN